MVEVIPTNSKGQEIKVTEPNGKKIILEKLEGTPSFDEIEKYQFKPTWSDECEVLENFKPMTFKTPDGKMAPQAKVIPLVNLPTDDETSVEKKKEKGKAKNNLFCDFCERKNHVTKNCFLLKAYDINKTTSLNDSKSKECAICKKKNHKTKECLYLKNFDEKIKEYKAKTLESQVMSTSKGKSKQTFESVQTSVTKSLNKNSAPREVQVTDAPPVNRLPRGYGQPTCHRLPHVYEEPKRPSKPKMNRHPHGFNIL